MKKLVFLLALCLFLFPALSSPVVEEVGTSVPSDSDNTYVEEDDLWQTIVFQGVEMEWDGYRVKESETDFDPETFTFDELGEGHFFQTEYEVERETYILNEGEYGEVEVFHIHSPNPGPTIYVVAGVHGDERAAWYAGIMLKKATIANGDLYIVAPANVEGASRRKRYVYASQDLNRSFPGKADGTEAEKVAYSIFEDIRRVEPVFVFDLHEAIVYTQGRDFLGSTYIFSDLDLMSDLFFSLLWATEDGELCHNAFGYTGPGPAGSVNRTVTEELQIPCITVETFRGFDIWRRVYDQLDTVQYTLEFYGMV